MRRSLAALALVILLAGIGCGCQPADSGAASSGEPLKDYPVTVFEVTVTECPQRVVSLSPAVTEILVELGSDAQLVGVSDACTVTRELPHVGTTVSPNLDAVAALEPDVIFTTTALSQQDQAAMEATGAKVIPVPGVARYSQLSTLYTRVAQVVSGSITGTRNAANTVDRLDETLQTFAKPTPARPLVAYYTATLLIPTGGLADEWIAFAGGVNVAPGERAEDAAVAASGASLLLCDAALTEEMQRRFPQMQVVAFDIAALESCGGRMTAAVAELNRVLTAAEDGAEKN